MLTSLELHTLIRNGKMVYCFDIDDTLLDFETHKPLNYQWKIIEHINKKFQEGNYIYLFTGRPYESKEYTERQLYKFGIKYNEIIFGKIKYHIQVDDSTINTLDYVKNPEFYDMMYKRIGNYIHALALKRGI